MLNLITEAFERLNFPRDPFPLHELHNRDFIPAPQRAVYHAKPSSCFPFTVARVDDHKPFGDMFFNIVVNPWRLINAHTNPCTTHPGTTGKGDVLSLLVFTF